MRTVIKVENNLKEILTFLEEKGYKWSSGDLPTMGVNWESKLIIVSGKTLTHRTIYTYEPSAITFETFKNKIDMKTSNILPGYKLVLRNGNSFIVKEYKNTKIIFPEGSSRSVMTLDDLCDENLRPRNDMSPIVKVFNSANTLVWKRTLTRTDIRPGFMMVNEDNIHYLVVECGNTLRIMSTKYFFVGAKLDEIMNEDLSPFDSNYATIVEIKDREGKVVYSKK